MDILKLIQSLAESDDIKNLLSENLENIDLEQIITLAGENGFDISELAPEDLQNAIAMFQDLNEGDIGGMISNLFGGGN